jgi:hypothetical protein
VRAFFSPDSASSSDGAVITKAISHSAQVIALIACLFRVIKESEYLFTNLMKEVIKCHAYRAVWRQLEQKQCGMS